MAERTLKRRLFLGALSALMWAPLLYGGYGALSGIRRCSWAEGAEDALARIGNVYLAEFPEEAAPGKLGALLAGVPSLAAGFRSDAAALARSAFTEACARELRCGDTVLCDGWLLARSEARLCGLIALQVAERGVSDAALRSG
ncbi:MAG: hypothetical protein AAFQ81_10205 [Pseudomonadota bacterium]